MNINEAYRKGQYDMRRKIERYWRRWHMQSIGMNLDPRKGQPLRSAFNGSRVDLITRKECRIQDLPEPPKRVRP